ncbi:MAG TPA: acyl-homoserine-lactone synthase [Gammaproteobacteria bacterium]|nr:acyl-homoserine-lactone synthase [Gammaproteobacteria bacterium]
MSEILIGRSVDGAFDNAVLQQLFRFRHRVFKERLGWEVASRRGMEYDDYDDLEPVHIAARAQSRIVGSWRLLPTTGPYMLRDTFPELLRGEAAPCASDVWELSRFAVEPEDRNARVQASCSETTFGMMRACYRYAVDAGIREFVTVTSVALERMMRNAGVPMARFGDGKATRVGKVLSVACRISIDETLEQALFTQVADANRGAA